eukprot:gene32357-3549_t
MDRGFSESVLEKEAAVEALTLWLSNDYDRCLQTLQRLESTSEKHTKTSHHVSVLSYYNDVVSATELLDQLNLLSEDHQGRQSEATSTSYNGKSTPNVKLPSESRQHLNATDASVIKLNSAILLFNRQQYEAAAEQLRPLYDDIESLFDGAALHVVLLLLDVHLALQQPVQAAATLATLERMVPPLTKRFRSHSGTAPGSSRSCSAKCDPTARGSGKANATSSSGGQMPAGAAITSSPAPGCDGASTASAAGRHIVLPLVSRWNSEPMQIARRLLNQQGLPEPQQPNIEQLVRHYRTRVAVLHRCPAAASSNTPNIAPPEVSCPPGQYADEEDCMGAIAQAQLQLLTGSHDEACKTLLTSLALLSGQPGPTWQGESTQGGLDPKPPIDLSTSSLLRVLLPPKKDQGGPEASAMANKPSSGGSSAEASPSSFPYDQAPPNSAPSRGASSSEFSGRSPLQECALLYNSAVQQMQLGNFSAALPSFRKAAQVGFWSQPLVMLRTAEAALGLFKQRQASLPSGGVTQQEGVPFSGAEKDGDRETSELLTEAVEVLGTAWYLLDEMHRQDSDRDTSELLTEAVEVLGTAWYLLDEMHRQIVNKEQEVSASVAAATFPQPPHPSGSSALLTIDAAATATTIYFPIANEEQEVSAAAAVATATAATFPQPPQPPGSSALLTIDATATAAPSSSSQVNGGSSSQSNEASSQLDPASSPSRDAPGGAQSSGLPEPPPVITPDPRLRAPGVLSWREQECNQLRQAILSNLAFSQLLRRDHDAALEVAQQLLAQQQLSSRTRCLAATYAAEALCALGREEEAVQLLRAQIDDVAEEVTVVCVGAGGGGGGAAKGSD